MSKCAGKGWDFCDSCVNQEISYECDDCEDGDNYEPADTEQELTMHELKFLLRKEAA
jgi:hypothetical protein